jgi:putative hemolysin
MTLVWHIVWILVGLLGSAFFAIETGLISLNRVRLRHDVERQNRRAIVLASFVDNTERLLGTTLVGTTLSNTLVAVFVSSLAAELFGHEYFVGVAATVVAAAIVLIIGEIVPKTLFRHYSYRLCMSCADALAAAAWLFAPLVVLLGVLMRAIARTSRDADQPRSFFVTREELKYLAREGEAGGALTSDEREMIVGVFDFPHKTMHEVMLPLTRTVTVARKTSVAELCEISQRTGFARFPVREADTIIGVVNVYEILFEASPRDRVAEQLMRKPQFVLSTDRVDRVLPRLRARRNPISIVVSPEGKHLGIVTIEDIVEEIVGEVEG